MSILAAQGGSTEGIAELFRLPPTVHPEPDASVGRWVEEALAAQTWATVRSSVPAGFEAYARVLHPAFSTSAEGRSIRVRWADIAASTGRTMHRLAQFERIAAIPDDPSVQPSWGVRPYARGVCDVGTPLMAVLRANTATADRCVFGVWEGYGGMDMVPAIASAARADCPNRGYMLFAGPLDGFFAFCGMPWEPPSVWWPQDRAWFVATDIDLDSTYIGGTSECIDAILADPGLEAFPANLDDPIHLGADEVNPPVEPT